MGKKQSIKSAVEKFTKALQETNRNIEKIQGDRDYSDTWKKARIDEAKAKLFEKRAEMVKEVEGYVGEARSASAKAFGNNQDPNYQLGLGNAIKMAELAGPGLSRADVMTLLDPFKSNVIAVEAIKRALASSGRDNGDLVNLRPSDVWESNVKLFDDLQATISNYSESAIDNQVFEGHMGAVVDKILSRVDDDLMVPLV